ncbi:MAG: hypothetical protein ABWZ78_17950 [Burkholderiaceae bacterium]
MSRHSRALIAAGARVIPPAAAVIAAIMVLGFVGRTGQALAQPNARVDCNQYQGTEKEACEKMMAKRR